MVFSLSFVGGSKSVEGGPYPPADLDRVADLDRGSKSRVGPNPQQTVKSYSSLRVQL